MVNLSNAWSGSPADSPFVLLVFDDHWTCALLRAELLERGVEAVCVRRLGAIVVPGSPISLASPVVVVAEQPASHERASVRDQSPHVLVWLRALDVLQAAVLVTSADAEAIDGPWDRVLRRPVVLGEIADTAEKLTRAPAPPPGHSAGGQPGGFSATVPGFEVRIGWPWPMVHCRRCSASRHCDLPRTALALGDVRTDLMKFGLAHGNCEWARPAGERGA